MNTKLIKQLESVGFESRGFESILKIGENYIFYYYHNIDDFTGYLDAEIIEDSNGRCVYIHPTFEEIIAAVKKHTGVDLQPKQTQRIEALEQGNQSLAEQIEELRAKQQGFEDLLKALNEKVSESESSQTPTPKVEDEPKLKMGAWAEVLGHSGFFRKGEKVLIISKLDEDGEYWCINKDKATEYHKPENLKPLQ